MEDVDETRCKPKFADDILRTLTAYGLQWDGEVMIQSQRKSAYQQALARLIAASHAYHCRCSRKEIADSATGGLGRETSNALVGIEGVVYPGTCRARQGLPAAFDLANHDNAAIRVLTNDRPISFTDRMQGICTQQLERDIGDFIVRRRDGLFAYQLAVVVDDAEQGITDVVRGVDLIDSTARQIYLQQLLGFSTPRYLHIPVITNREGQKLSKQTLAPALSAPGSASASASMVTINQTIIRALTLLGQPTEMLAANDPTATLLRLAASRWQGDKLPAARRIRFTEN